MRFKQIHKSGLGRWTRTSFLNVTYESKELQCQHTCSQLSGLFHSMVKDHLIWFPVGLITQMQTSTIIKTTRLRVKPRDTHTSPTKSFSHREAPKGLKVKLRAANPKAYNEWKSCFDPHIQNTDNLCSYKRYRNEVFMFSKNYALESYFKHTTESVNLTFNFWDFHDCRKASVHLERSHCEAWCQMVSLECREISEKGYFLVSQIGISGLDCQSLSLFFLSEKKWSH